MRGLRVALTGIASDAGASAAARIRRAGHEVVGIDSGLLPWGLRSRFCNKYEAIEGDRLAEGLLEVVRRERPDVLLPFGSRFVQAAIGIKEQLEGLTRLNVPEMATFESAFRKGRCMEACARLGVAHPAVFSEEGAYRCLSAGALPDGVVVKPDHDAGNARGLSYVRSAAELRPALERCRGRFGDALIQECIPGSSGQMRTVILLFDRASRLAGGVTMRKTRQWPYDGGVTAFGLTTDDEALVRAGAKLLGGMGWRGGAEVEMKVDPRDGAPKVIEINPRFPSHFRIAAAAGADLPVLAVELAMGRPAPAAPLMGASGTRYCNPGKFVLAVREELRRSGWSAAVMRSAMNDLPAALGAAVTRATDPAPMAGRVLSGVLGRWRKSASGTVAAEGASGVRVTLGRSPR